MSASTSPSHPSALAFLVRPLLWVLIPSLLLGAYWRFIYTPVYEAVVVAVPRSGERPTTTDPAGAMLGSALRSKDIDSRMLEHYIRSPDMLALVDADLDVRGHFSASSIQPLQRLDPDANAEEFLEHFRHHVRIIVDSSSLLHVEVKAYDATYALKLADRILAHSEAKLNAMSVQMAEKQVAFIQREVTKAEKLFKENSAKLASYQNEAGQFDPARYSEGIMSVVATLEAELAKEQATLTGKQIFLSGDASQLTLSRARIAALGSEIAALRARLADRTEDPAHPRLSAEIMRFNTVLLETEFAAKTYSASLLALQAAHAEAAFTVRTLITISRPAALDRPAYPRTGYWMLTALLLSALLITLFKLVYDTVASHIDR